jgi:hypothetical protein
MTPRERLMASLEGRPTDRVPVWLLFPYHPVSYYVDVRTHPLYKPVFEASRERGVIMLDRRNLGAPLHTADVTTRKEPIPGGGERAVLDYRGKAIYSGSGKKLLDDDADLEFYASLPVETDPARITAALDRQLPGYLREKAEFPPDAGSMMLDLGSPVGPLYHQSNLESYAIWSLTHADLVEELLKRFMVRLRLIYRYTLERDLADVYFLVGSELASPPLLRLETFRRWLVPFEKELIALIHSYGKKVIQHYHGQIREVLPDFVEMAPDGLHTIEAPPVGNCTLDQAYGLVGDRITLIGNIQYDEFRSRSAEEMERAVHAVLEEAAGRRLILSPTAGPFDPAPPARLIENYLAFMQAV